MTKDRPDKRERITGRLKVALDAMIWGNPTGKPLAWNEAARASNISARSMRKSLERPAVRMYLHQQKQVFRACLSAATLSRLHELASQDENRNAAVAAIREIEARDDVQSRSINAQTPGITIVLEAPRPTTAMLDAKPAVLEHVRPELDANGHPIRSN
jgi:hypothetical protein